MVAANVPLSEHGTHLIDTVTVAPHTGIAGMDDIRFNLPRDFPLRLFQLVSIETPDGVSNSHWIYLD